VDLIGLAELAKEKGVKKNSLLTAFRAVEKERPGVKIVYQPGNRGKVWCDRDAVRQIDLETRVKAVEARAEDLEKRVDNLEGAA